MGCHQKVGTSVLCDSDRFAAIRTVTCIHLSASKHQFVVCCQGSDLSDNTYYIFNHLNIVIEIQRIVSDQSDDVPKNAGRIVRAKLIPQRLVNELYYTHTHTHPFNSPFSVTTQVSQYQKGKTNLDFTEARDSEWQ